MAKSGGSTLGTILKWALILAVVYVIYRWWVGFSTASATTTAVSSTTPVAVAPPSSGYANPGGFFSPQPIGPILFGGGPLSWYPGPPAPSPIIAAPNPNPPVLAKPGDNWWDKIWTGPVGLRSFGGPSA